MILPLGIAALSASPIGHVRREDQLAKHARHRKNDRKETDKEKSRERRERTTLAIRIALLIYAIARSISGN